jgi:hypothetical protein
MPRPPIAVAVAAVFLLIASPGASAATRTVCGDASCGFSSIQSAVNASSAGDTVSVAPGRYDENVVLDRAINLVGAAPDAPRAHADDVAPATDAAAVIAPTAGVAMTVTSDAAVVDGFTVIDSSGPGPAIEMASTGRLTRLDVRVVDLGVQVDAPPGQPSWFVGATLVDSVVQGTSAGTGVAVHAGGLYGHGVTYRRLAVALDHSPATDAKAVSVGDLTFEQNQIGIRCAAGRCLVNDSTFQVPPDGVGIDMRGSTDLTDLAGNTFERSGDVHGQVAVRLDGSQTHISVRRSVFHGMTPIAVASGFTSPTTYVAENRYQPPAGQAAIVNDSSSAIRTYDGWFGCEVPGACPRAGGTHSSLVSIEADKTFHIDIDNNFHKQLSSGAVEPLWLFEEAHDLPEPGWTLQGDSHRLPLVMDLTTDLGTLASTHVVVDSLTTIPLTVGGPISNGHVWASMDGATIVTEGNEVRLGAVGMVGTVQVAGARRAGSLDRCVEPTWTQPPDRVTFTWRNAKGRTVGSGRTHRLSLLDGDRVACVANAELAGHWTTVAPSRLEHVIPVAAHLQVRASTASGRALACGLRPSRPCIVAGGEPIRLRFLWSPGVTVKAAIKLRNRSRRGWPTWVTGWNRLPSSSASTVPRKFTEPATYIVTASTPVTALTMPCASRPLYVQVR